MDADHLSRLVPIEFKLILLRIQVETGWTEGGVNHTDHRFEVTEYHEGQQPGSPGARSVPGDEAQECDPEGDAYRQLHRQPDQLASHLILVAEVSVHTLDHGDPVPSPTRNLR